MGQQQIPFADANLLSAQRTNLIASGSARLLVANPAPTLKGSDSQPDNTTHSGSAWRNLASVGCYPTLLNASLAATNLLPMYVAARPAWLITKHQSSDVFSLLT